jgi:ribonuclease D
MEKLSEVVGGKLWLLHSATQDLPCLAELGIVPTKVFDTELAARLIGVEKFGLSSIALELLGLEMAKEHSAADWSMRPLSEEMLIYAALDVDVMHELYIQLTEKLAALSRTSWAEQEFQRLLSFKPKPQPIDAWRNLPGISKIKETRRLQIAAALHQARDRFAAEKDIAPGRLIPDRSIMAAVNQVPATKKELAGNKEFQGRASRSMLSEWWDAIEGSTDLVINEAEHDDNHIPNHRSWERRFPEAHARLQLIRPLVAQRATELGLAVEILISPDSLRRVCFQPQPNVRNQLRELGVREWQIELVSEVIEAGLSLSHE